MKKTIITEICDKCNIEDKTTPVTINGKRYDFCASCESGLIDGLSDKGEDVFDSLAKMAKDFKPLEEEHWHFPYHPYPRPYWSTEPIFRVGDNIPVTYSFVSSSAREGNCDSYPKGGSANQW